MCNQGIMDWLILWALLVALLWGVTPVIHKHILVNTKPSTVIFIGGMAYFTCMIVYAHLNKKDILHDFVKMDKTTIALIACTSVVAGFAANYIYMHVLKDAESYIVSALVYSSPAFTLIFAHLFLQEKMSFMGFGGVMLIVAGILCISIDH